LRRSASRWNSGGSVWICAWWGCSFYPDDSQDVATLLRHAFIAFDQAESDVSHVAVYTEAINPYSERRLTLMTELRRAIHEDALSLHFQPQVRVSSGEVCGFEVLLRWTHRSTVSSRRMSSFPWRSRPG